MEFLLKLHEQHDTTIIMVTHDNDLAQRVKRTIIIVDGEIIEEYLQKTFPSLSQQQLVWTSARMKKERQPAGSVILRQGEQTDKFYLITRGQVELSSHNGSGPESLVSRLGAGEYFGEHALLNGGESPVTARVPDSGDAEMVYMEASDFKKLMNESEETRQEVEAIAARRMKGLKK